MPFLPPNQQRQSTEGKLYSGSYIQLSKINPQQLTKFILQNKSLSCYLTIKYNTSITLHSLNALKLNQQSKIDK